MAIAKPSQEKNQTSTAECSIKTFVFDGGMKRKKEADTAVMHSGWIALSTVSKQVSQSKVVLDTFCCYSGGGFLS